LLRGGEQLSHVIQQARIRRQVRPRPAADRLLIDDHKALDCVEAFGDLAPERLNGRLEAVVIYVAALLALAQSVGNGVNKELSYQARLVRAREFRSRT
jgi:hypothetical protein